jgi:uncharacterized protein (DUF1810 family)
VADLDRFVDAQDAGGTYATALAEVRAGRKRTHWMWFVFPQVTGLGRSSTARQYAIASLDEAIAYLGHPVLGPRLREIAAAASAIDGATADDVFGTIDAVKLRSSMTLFALAAGPSSDEPFRRVLERHFDGVPDPETERLLAE